MFVEGTWLFCFDMLSNKDKIAYGGSNNKNDDNNNILFCNDVDVYINLLLLYFKKETKKKAFSGFHNIVDKSIIHYLNN